MKNQDYTDIELSKPVNVDGVEVAKLRMREPTVQDQLDADAMKGGAAEQEVALIANLCEVAPEAIKRLPLRDYKQLQVAFMGFTE
jgi:hypothetical protein